MILKQWKKFLFIGSLFVLLGAMLWGSSSNPVYACDYVEGNYLDCDFEFEFQVRVIEKINVYWYENNGSLLCYRVVWVYVYDSVKLRDNRATNAPVYPSYGSIGLFTRETFERLINEGVIQEAPYVVLGSTTEECISWGEGHIQEDGPAEWPEDPPELLDPIDPPFWRKIVLDEPIDGASQLYAYGQETEEGFYALFYFLPLE